MSQDTEGTLDLDEGLSVFSWADQLLRIAERAGEVREVEVPDVRA